MDLIHDPKSQDILDKVDMDKINMTDKKKRGRPKKSQQLTNPLTNKIKINDVLFEHEEIILHLPISTNDIKYLKKKENKNNNNDNDNDSDDNDNDDNDENDDNNNVLHSDKNSLNTDEDDNKKQNTNQKQHLQIIKNLMDENDKLKKYLIDITPMYFTEVKSYPSDLNIFNINNNTIIPIKTNLRCWWCTYKFDCLPSFIPEKYHDGKFYVFGNFCSFNCAGAYNLNLNDNYKHERYSLMKQMYYKINKNNISSINDIEINVAGPKELLKKYGGTMTIEEYRKNSKILGREYHILMPPFLPINVGFEETTNGKTNSKTMNINNIINPNFKDNIVVKRNKPLGNVISKEINTFT
jgi:hypothetical protein